MFKLTRLPLQLVTSCAKPRNNIRSLPSTKIAQFRYSSTTPPAEESTIPPLDEGASSEKVVSKNLDKELIDKLQKEVKDLKDQVLRCYAEEENVRRIAKRDVDSAKSYANTSFAKSMLEVADNLERALHAVPQERKKSAEDKVLKSLVEGIEMTEKDLQKTFLKFGVHKFGKVGDSFDPTLHEALFRIPDATKEAGKIGQVLKTGYKLHDRVIRAAEVGTIFSPDE